MDTTDLIKKQISAESGAWAADLRHRIALVRVDGDDRGVRPADVTQATGLSERAVRRLASTARNVHLSKLVAFCLGYRVELRHMLDGWRGDVPHFTEPPAELLDEPALSANVRANLVHLALASTWSLPRITEVAWGSTKLQSTLTRWASGEYGQIDVLRLHRVVLAYRYALDDDAISIHRLITTRLP